MFLSGLLPCQAHDDLFSFLLQIYRNYFTLSEPTGETLSLTDFRETMETFKGTIDSGTRGIYDKVIIDSGSQPERAFASSAEKDRTVVCFLKLPSFYKIPTPLGNYEPDFGIVVRKKAGIREQDEEEYYFVIETKGTNDMLDMAALRESERFKIECAKKHFARLGILADLNYTPYYAPVQDYKADFKSKIP